jgi:hypothetical protein
VNPKTKNKTAATASLADEARRLVDTAAKQPGVAELCRVYEAWQRYDQVFQTHHRLTAAKQIVSISNSSGPALRQVI